MVTPREDQLSVISLVIASLASGKRAPCFVCPTAWGKGEVLATITRMAADKGSRSVFLIPRRELVNDFSKRLYRYGINHGIYLGAKTRQTHLPVQVASVDTLNSRVKRLPKFDLAIIDEAHTALSERYSKVLEAIGNPIIVGATATPCRLDGKGLGNLFDDLILGPTVAESIERGWLVNARVFAPSIPDLTGMKSLGGDFNLDELATAMENSRLVGDTVSTWRELNEGQASLGFAVNCHHGRVETEAFNAAGIAAEFLDGESSDAERAATWARSRSGETKIVWTVGIASYGFDAPWIKHGVFARPTQSLALWLQQVGRLLRIFEDHKYCIVQDHSGNTIRHGFIDEPREWTLENKRRRGKSKDEELPLDKLPQVCPKCKQVAKPGTRLCPCGYEFAFVAARQIEHVDGKLTEITERPRFSDAAYGTSDDPAVARIIEAAKRRGSKPGQVFFLTKDLESAREEYRRVKGTEPKPVWNAQVLRAICERHLANA